jgi:cytochrome c-type biogenesis protein
MSVLIVGITFGAGWTSCIGPILAGIFTLSASSTSLTIGAILLGAYSSGLAIPFIISAIAIDRFLIFFKKIRRWIPWIERTSGILLIAMGILLVTGSFTVLSSIFGGGVIPN